MKTIPDIVGLHVLGGECGDKEYCGNQYQRYVLTPLWTTEQWQGTLQGCIDITSQLALIWQTLSDLQKKSWSKLSNRFLTSNYCEFIRTNYQRLFLGLDPILSL